HLERLDVRAAVRFLRDETPDHKIGVIGWSLGGASALLADVDVDAMVLESVFPTFKRTVHNRVEMRLGVLHHVLAPLLWLQLKPRLGVSTSQLRPLDHIASLQCPVLIAAGDVDQRCTVEESRKLFEHAQEPRQWLLFEGARHEDLFRFDQETYSKSVLQFLDESLRD
ncbi:MAG: alpha/beta hydrolase, partial [Planctomycetota bacterium]